MKTQWLHSCVWLYTNENILMNTLFPKEVKEFPKNYTLFLSFTQTKVWPKNLNSLYQGIVFTVNALKDLLLRRTPVADLFLLLSGGLVTSVVNVSRPPSVSCLRCLYSPNRHTPTQMAAPSPPAREVNEVREKSHSPPKHLPKVHLTSYRHRQGTHIRDGHRFVYSK